MIIPFFIMNRGCRHRCIFCNEKLTAGNHSPHITADAFNQKIRSYSEKKPLGGETSQIAFYGGTFTGLEQGEQKRLLDLALPFLQEGRVDSIRISTRPDEIDPVNLDFLKNYGVTTIEIGVQSLDDGVLLRSRRGHTAADSIRAMGMLKEKGFVTGIHLMPGLPGDTPDGFAHTVEAAIALKPDTVRIHPTIVLSDTALARDFLDKRYRPLTLQEAVDISARALKRFTAAGIPVIRLGLQSTRELEEAKAVVAGPFHPAFRSLVEEQLFFEMAQRLLATVNLPGGEIIFSVSPSDISSMMGAGRKNMGRLKNSLPGGKIRVIQEPLQKRGTLALLNEKITTVTDFSGAIVRQTTGETHPVPHER